jgi:hypothetical protein
MGTPDGTPPLGSARERERERDEEGILLAGRPTERARQKIDKDTGSSPEPSTSKYYHDQVLRRKLVRSVKNETLRKYSGCHHNRLADRSPRMATKSSTSHRVYIFPFWTAGRTLGLDLGLERWLG